MPTTTMQKPNAVRAGSVRIQIGDNFGALTDIGAIRNPVFTSLVTNQAIEFDNVDDLKKFADGKKVQFTFDLAEINLTNLAEFDAGLISLTTTAGSLQSGQNEVIGSGDWSFDVVIELANQNADGTAPTINSVTGGTDGALTVNTDYKLVKLANGNWGVSIISGAGASTEAQSITVNSDYTPAASKNITFADKGTKTYKVVRVSNIDENGNEFRIDMEKATNFSAPSIDFAGDTEEDVAIMGVQLEGDLVEIVDEQQTT